MIIENYDYEIPEGSKVIGIICDSEENLIFCLRGEKNVQEK